MHQNPRQYAFNNHSITYRYKGNSLSTLDHMKMWWIMIAVIESNLYTTF